MAKNNNEENISNNQVMAMFESLNENISFIAGEVSGLKENFSNFKQETENNFKTIFDWQSSFSDNFDEELKDVRRELEEIKVELAKRPTGKMLDVLVGRISGLEIRVDKMEKVKVC